MKYARVFSKKLGEHLFFIVTVAAIAIFTLIGYKNLDPDFGWHYQLGKIITTTGIPKTDPFTFTMPSYPFVDYEWGSNILIYEVYSHFGKFTLSFLYSLFAVVSIRILITKKNKELLLIYILCLSVFVPFVGIRPQVLAWVFISLLVRFLFNKKAWIKWRWGFPLLMLLWANMHGSYPLAFVFFGAYKFGELLQEKRVFWTDIFVFIVGLVATIINPYGIHNWIEVIKQMGQTALFRKTIGEWQPVYSNLVLGYWFLLALFVFLTWRYKAKILLPWIIVSSLTAIMAFSSARHIPIFALTTIPVLELCLYHLKKEVSKIPFGIERHSKLLLVLISISSIILITQCIFAYKMGYKEQDMFPLDALAFIQNNVGGKMYNNYNWGGYLIWKLPNRKVFIDGRTSGFNWQGPKDESDFIFKDYLQINAVKGDWLDKLNKFDINFVLLPTKDLEYNKQSLPLRALTKWYVKWFVGWGDDTYYSENTLAIALQDLNWKIVYKDNVSVILKRP